MKKIVIAFFIIILSISCSTLNTSKKIGYTEKQLIYAELISLANKLCVKAINENDYPKDNLLEFSLRNVKDTFNKIPLYNNYLNSYLTSTYNLSKKVIKNLNSIIDIKNIGEIDDAYFNKNKTLLVDYYFKTNSNKINKLISEKVDTYLNEEYNNLQDESDNLVDYYNLYINSLEKIPNSNKYNVAINGDINITITNYIYSLYYEIMRDNEIIIKKNYKDYNNDLLSRAYGVQK